jgi:hypothetical protein
LLLPPMNLVLNADIGRGRSASRDVSSRADPSITSAVVLVHGRCTAETGPGRRSVGFFS